MASADLKQELDCSICLSTYTDPVMLRCGHNFCRVCIDNVLDTQDRSGGYFCPECRAEFQDRPVLHRNITLRNIAETFRSIEPDQEKKTTGIFCTYCIHSPVPAVKSCLHCEASLCDDHLRVHSKSPVHVLTEPTTSMEKRKCSVHRKILEYFCLVDATCICVSCRLDGKHRGHKVETLDVASEKKKQKLRTGLQKLITEREETEKRVRSLQERRRKVQEKSAGVTERVTALFRDLRRHLEDLEKRVLREISRQEERLSHQLSDLIQGLEIKDQLSRKMDHIEEMCNMTDPLTVLQESDTGDLCDTEEGDDEDRERRDTEEGDDEDRERHDELLHDGGDLDVAGLSHTLHSGLSDMMKGVNVCFNIQEASDIVLDVNTAHNILQISEDMKTVSMSDIKQNRPETPERFQTYNQVFSSRKFSSGRHYWEVDVSGSDWWVIGMCYPSIERRGVQSVIAYNNKSWGLYSDTNQCLVLHNSTMIQLPDNISSNRVRIYLDYEAGQLSFYDLCDPIRHLHTFTTTFTEPLHPALRVVKGHIKISGGSGWEK
ncbi:PREDICTED: E3 ubiquitin/ISG15 ligase TRIM25-like [Nanorana parkeri]|uniref:E3 ubiquitin/ISG15 ligase TRIM25-like n=1 Tax=Nanorana parkeri TaxID=125878 RepID=UPI000854D4BA|nr:PREDICTED: E3 ubiquitin/ISG15 ligase TRIM25-like [Nanorana parkeri]